MSKVEESNPAPAGERPWRGFKHLAVGDQRQLAWLGDAVLALWAREWLERNGRGYEQDAFSRMTSNQFLNAFGQPDTVEAWIGSTFKEQGYEATRELLNTHLIPVFLRQEANGVNLRRPSGHRRDKRR